MNYKNHFSVINFDYMNLEEIERYIGIEKYKGQDYTDSVICETWEQVEGVVKEVEKYDRNFYVVAYVLGYEIYLEDYVKVYYSYKVTNS